MKHCRSGCLAFAFLSAALSTSHSEAQDANDVVALVETTKVVLVEGPYQYQDGSGLVGYVVARAKHQVDFKPCGGVVISIEDSKLKKVSTGCGSEPPDDPGQVRQVSCPTLSSTDKLIRLAGDGKPTGEVFADVNAAPITDQKATSEWRKALEALSPAQQDCGSSVIFASNPDMVGSDHFWVGIVKPADALMEAPRQ